jgi:cyclohexanone monooxygenase
MTGAIHDFDAVVVGAGFAGMYVLKSLRDKSGLKVRVLSTAKQSAAPGTGTAIPARGTIPTRTLIAAPGTNSCCKSGNGRNVIPSSRKSYRYLEHVAKRHDLKHDIQFNCPRRQRRIRRDCKPMAGDHGYPV